MFYQISKLLISFPRDGFTLSLSLAINQREIELSARWINFLTCFILNERKSLITKFSNEKLQLTLTERQTTETNTPILLRESGRNV